jgi:hypothetical protein
MLGVGSDAQQCEQLLEALLSTNNDVRKQAEASYEKLAENPAGAAQALMHVLTAGSNEGPRQQAAVLLRQLLGRRNKADKTKKNLDLLGDLSAFKALLLAQLEKEPSATVRRGLASLVAFQAENLPGKVTDGWPEMLPKLLSLIQVPDRRQAVLLVLKELSEELAPALAGQPAMASVLQACMQDADPEVRASTLELGFLFAQSTKKTQWDVLKPCTPALFQLAVELRTSKPKVTQELLQAANDVAQESPLFLKDSIATVVLPACLSFGRAADSEVDIRRFALQVLVTLAAYKNGKLVLQIPDYVSSVVALCCEYTLTLDDDDKAWAEAEDEKGDGEDEGDELFDFAKEMLDELCNAKCLGGEKVLPVLYPKLAQLMAQNDWKSTVAMLALMATIAEYIESETEVDQMVEQTLKLLVNPNMRIRHGAWGCIAQFAEDHEEHVPEKFGNACCQAFILALEDPVNRVLQRALEGFQMVVQFIDRDLLEPACKPILEKLAARAFSAGQRPQLVCEAVTVISILAQQMEEGFGQYYQHLMPLIMKALQASSGAVETRECFGRCMECVANLGKSAGVEVFRKDAGTVMQVMLDACKNLTDEDVATEYILTAAESICATLKAEFAPFVPTVLPIVLKKLVADPVDLNSGEIDLDEATDTQLTITVTTTAEGEQKVLGLKTTQIEDMQSALSLIKTMVDQMSESYAPHIQDTARGLLPVFDFELGEEVRDTAFEVWGSLITVARKCKQQAVLQELLQSMMGRVLVNMETTDDLAWELTQANGMATAFKAAGPGVLQDADITTVGTQIFKLLEESFGRRDELAKQKAEKKDDDEDDGDAQEDADSEDFNVETVDIKIRTSLLEILGAVMAHHPDGFVKLLRPQMITMLGGFLSQANPEYKEEDLKLAVYVTCDVIEHLKERAVDTWPTLLPPMIQSVTATDMKIAQAAAYGLALVAPFQQFSSFAATAAGQLKLALSKLTKKKKKDKVRALAVRDNAVSAFGLLLRHHSAAVGAAGGAPAWKEWLGFLPCKTDEEEAQKVHELLVTLVQEQYADVIGTNYANVSQILGILSEIYGTELVTKETTVKIQAIVKTLGESGLSQFGAACSGKQQKKLERIWREGQASSGFAPASRT